MTCNSQSLHKYHQLSRFLEDVRKACNITIIIHHPLLLVMGYAQDLLASHNHLLVQKGRQLVVQTGPRLPRAHGVRILVGWFRCPVQCILKMWSVQLPVRQPNVRALNARFERGGSRPTHFHQKEPG